MAFAVDANSLPVPSCTATGTVTSSDTAATLPASVTFVNGRAMFPVTFATAGPQTLTLTDSADSLTVTAPTTVATAPDPNPDLDSHARGGVAIGDPAAVHRAQRTAGTGSGRGRGCQQSSGARL